MIKDRLPRRNWLSHANELLRHLHRGSLLIPENLHSLHITLQKPTPIIPLPAVVDYIPLFLNSEDGKDWIYSRDQELRAIEEESDTYVKQDNLNRELSDFAARMLKNAAESMGDSNFWRGEDEKNKKWITPVVRYTSTFCLPSYVTNSAK